MGDLIIVIEYTLIIPLLVISLLNGISLLLSFMVVHSLVLITVGSSYNREGIAII